MANVIKSVVFAVMIFSTVMVIGEEAEVSYKKIAVNQAVIAAKMVKQLNDELNALGINGTALAKDVVKHPLKHRVPVPEHKRKRVIIFSNEHEQIIEADAIKELKKSGKLYSSPKQEKRVRDIASRIINVLPEKIPLNIYLIKDDSLNAFCLIGGSIFIHSGTLNILKEDNMLAAIIAHEYAHAVSHHCAENLTKILMKTAGDVYTDEMAKKLEEAENSGKGFLLQASYGLGSKFGVLLPYSRKMELEADRLSIIYMHRAGYNPNGAVAALEKIDKLYKYDNSILSELMSTHPNTSKRIEYAKRVIDEDIKGISTTKKKLFGTMRNNK